jgi:acetate kinase
VKLCVVNAGSSSLKLQWLDMTDERLLLKAAVDRLGSAAARLTLTLNGTVETLPVDGETMEACLERIRLAAQTRGLPAPAICVHRVVHGGERFTAPTLIDDEALTALHGLVPLAPLHMPANIEGIMACRTRFPSAPQVAVFDTAFHATIPPQAYRYAIPSRWHALGIRRYGFHGSSHQYVSHCWHDWQGLAPTAVNLVTVHLGNGSSLCAIRGGQSVDTTMGLTPLEGMVMGTRSGNLDPGIPGTVARLTGESAADIDHALWHEAGLKGLCGSSDMRDILARADAGDTEAALARDVFCQSLRRHLGAMLAVNGRTDAIIMTGGIGENAAALRAQALGGLEALGIVLCPERNAGPGAGKRLISTDASPIAVAVIPTNEELQMARLAVRSVQRPT